MFVVAATIASLSCGGNAEKASSSALFNTGRGTAIVFSPDLAPGDTSVVYSRLGFTVFRDPSWRNVMMAIERLNRRSERAARIRVVILECHSSNGNALKLQVGKSAVDARSYASIDALREHLAASGVEVCVITACNAGRLFRPSVVRGIDSTVFDPLLQPATLGVLPITRSGHNHDATTFLIPRSNNLEAITEIRAPALAAGTRAALGLTSRSSFAVSETLVQLLVERNPTHLVPAAPTDTLSRTALRQERSAELTRAFCTWLDHRARSTSSPQLATMSCGDACERVLSLVR